MASLLAKYRDRQAEVIREASEIQDRIEAEDREPHEDEVKHLDGLQAENERLKPLIAREEGYQELRRSLPRVPDGNQDAERRAKAGNARPKFDSLGQFFAAVKLAAVEPSLADRRLQWVAGAPSGQGERNAADGGYLIGTDMSSEIMEGMYKLTRIAPMCRPLEIGPDANGATVTHIDETSRANGSRYGNVLAYWRGEADTLQLRTIKFRQEEQRLEKITCLFYATDEMLEDSVALTSFINDAAPEELAFRLDDSLIRGTGAGMPKGVLNCADLLVTVLKESGQAAATINAENIKKMYARMWPSSLGSAVWLCNQDCLPQLWSLRDTGGTFPQMMPSLQEVPPMTILGRPVYPVEQCETVGTKGDLILSDWRQYRLIRKGGVKSDSSIHVRYLQQETAFRFTLRVNGQPVRQKALTPYKGTATISPFVVLETRA
jgi:HK97 family phage major capsid protein